MKPLLLTTILACFTLTACQSIATKEGSLSSDPKTKYVNIKSFINKKTLACEEVATYSDFVNALSKYDKINTFSPSKPMISENYHIFGVKSYTIEFDKYQVPHNYVNVNILKHGLHILRVSPVSYSGNYGGEISYRMLLQGSPTKNQAIAKQRGINLVNNLQEADNGNTELYCQISGYVI